MINVQDIWKKHCLFMDTATRLLSPHFDANETALLTRQLEYIKQKTYDIEYPALKARTFIPVSNEVPSGAETVTYRQWNEAAQATIIANYADDLPRVDAHVAEFNHKIHGIGASYHWTIQDLRRAAQTNVQIDVRRARIARNACERTIDQLAAFGDADAGIGGFVNNANVPLTAPVTGTWSGATAAQILVDMHTLVQAIVDNTMEVHKPDTLLLDNTLFGLIATTPVGTDNQNTILKTFLTQSPYITNVDQWSKLALADAAGTGPRLLCYQRSPDVLSLEIPQDYEQFSPQMNNLAFKVPAHARCGGVLFYYPLAASYMDGC